VLCIKRSNVHLTKVEDIGRIADFVVEKPMVLGHETAGFVVAVGHDVEDLKVGDRVCMEPGETCRKCATCKEGKYNLCKRIKFAATPPTDGTLAGYVRPWTILSRK
jgi:D-xylulose reductase